MSNCSSVSVSASTILSLAADRALCVEAGLEQVVDRQGVGDVAGQRELLDALRQRGVRRRLEDALVVHGGLRVTGLGGHVDGVLAALAAGLRHDRAVVRRLRLVVVGERADAATGAADRRERAGGPVVADEVDRLLGHLPAGQPVAQGGKPLGDPVDRGRGDDEQAEHGEQDEQRHDHERRAQQVHQQAGGDVTQRAARALQVGGVPQRGLGRAVGQVHETEDPEQQGGPADQLPAGRAVGLGVAHGAPAHRDQQQRREPADDADRAGDDGAGQLGDAAGELPPLGGRHHDGQADQQQPDAVATVRGVELGGGATDPADHSPDDRGGTHPRGTQRAPDHGEELQHGTGAGPHRPGGRTLRAPARTTGPRARGPAAGRTGARAARARRRSGGRLARTRRGRRTGRHARNTR